MINLESMLKEITENGYYTCSCGNHVEPDGDCYCGRPNPLKEAGLI